MAQKWMKYGVGLDLSKDHMHACIGGLTPGFEYKIIGQHKFDNTAKGWSELDKWIEKHRKEKEVMLRVVLEVTGVYHEGVLYYLHGKGLGVCLELSKRTKKYMESIGHKSKNDKLDGQGLARMACEREGKLWQPASAQILSIRTLLRHRKAMISSCNQLKNQLHALNHSALGQAQVKHSLKQLIKAFQKQISQAEAQLLDLAKEDPDFYFRLTQITASTKGLAFITVLTVLAETNAFENFTSARQVVSYSGYDVIDRSSGTITGKTRISKQGNAHIRSAMYMPALAVIRHKVSPFYQLYLRLLARNGGLKKKAAVAVQRKLLVLIYTLWKNKAAFDPNYHLKFNNQAKQSEFDKTSSSDFTPELHEIEHALAGVSSH